MTVSGESVGARSGKSSPTSTSTARSFSSTRTSSTSPSDASSPRPPSTSSTSPSDASSSRPPLRLCSRYSSGVSTSSGVSARSWTDVPTAAYVAHAAAECSNKGTCNRATGICQCFSGFSGDKCQRRDCLNDCSGHGRCVSIKKMATLSDALPLSAKTTYAGDEETTRWDQDMVYGCVCDSSWGVGLGSGQTQQPEWFGPSCSLRRCPSGDNPMTRADETNCTNVTAAGGYGVGRAGNLCHVDCADRGSCDHETGECNCWTGAYGHDCTLSSALAM